MGVVPLRRKYTSLMLSATQTTLTEKSRDVSAASDMSNLSVDSSVSDFLERKIRLHRASVEYFREYKNGLLQLRSSNQLGEKDFCAEMGDAEKEILPAAEELKVLRRQRRTLASDMEESCEDSITEPKRPNLALEPSFEFLERAYTSTMVSRVMASSKQKRSRFNQAQFRKDVIKYLNADPDPENSGRIWCHLDGWLISKYVKAAHLVPKSLRGEEVAFLFGGDDLELANPRNGKPLCKSLSQLRLMHLNNTRHHVATYRRRGS